MAEEKKKKRREIVSEKERERGVKCCVLEEN